MDLLKLEAGSPLLDKISQSPFHGYKATEKDNPTPIRIHKRSGVAYLDCLHPPCLWFQDLGTWREWGRLTICLLCLERERRGKCTFDIESQENSMLSYVLITKRLDKGGGRSSWLVFLAPSFIGYLTFYQIPLSIHFKTLWFLPFFPFFNLFLVPSMLLSTSLKTLIAFRRRISSTHRWVG